MVRWIRDCGGGLEHEVTMVAVVVGWRTGLEITALDEVVYNQWGYNELQMLIYKPRHKVLE